MPGIQTRFTLAAPTGAAALLVLPEEPECVRLAAADLARDIERIAGVRPRIVSRVEECAPHTVVVGSASVPASAQLLERLAPGGVAQVRGRWEAYRVRSVAGEVGPIRSALAIAGSDERGAMFGVYAFIERYLGVDPLYFWNDREPAKRAELAWDSVTLAADEPTFRFRGWFINDEDLLTEWMGSGGKRDIDYPFYHQVTHPDALARVFEAMLRLQCNLVIPASFTDITNPAEEAMVQAASRRGLFVSQHHVEPLGVSAFAFNNYWKHKAKDVPYSYVRHPEAFEEVWRHFAERWAGYPNIVWQLGLRGIADRPIWVSDPSVPGTPEARGKLISDAVRTQWKIVRSVDKRPQPLATTTLWMEGAELNQQGHLTFPPGLSVIFSDNSPGSQWQRDFYETKHEPGREYGVYYHHGLWNSGPHLAQFAAPQRTYRQMKQAVERDTHWYAICNVANVREFVLGLDATARMLRDFPAFDPDRYLSGWCAERFGAAAADAERAYRAFFASYAENDARDWPVLMDGQSLLTGLRLWQSLLDGKAAPMKADDRTRLLEHARRQRAALEAIRLDPVQSRLDGAARAFFDVNLVWQHLIMRELTRWVESALLAADAHERGDRDGVKRQVTTARAAILAIRVGQALATRGPKWTGWFRGEKKMNLKRAEDVMERLVQKGYV